MYLSLEFKKTLKIFSMKSYHTHEINKYQLLYTAYDAVTNAMT